MNKKVFYAFILLMVITTKPVYGYEPFPPETIYTESANQQRLLQIIPMGEMGVEGLTYEIIRKALTVIIYDKKSLRIEGVEETIYYWEEKSFFRVQHPDSVKGELAEAIQGLISNDGNRVIIFAQINPMARLHPATDFLYVYDREGSLLKSFTQEEIFEKQIKDIHSISMDEGNYQMRVKSVENEIKEIDLESFNIR